MIAYSSDRNILLAYEGPPPVKGIVLTVECYCKWYNIYTVRQHGKIKTLPHRYVERYENEHEGSCAWSEHIPTLEFCKWLGDTFPHMTWDDNALALIIGKWLLEERPMPLLGGITFNTRLEWGKGVRFQ